MRILVTGATGYIGGRLIPRLLEAGHDVVVLVRNPKRIESRPWSDDVDVITGDLLKPGSFDQALHGVDAAYYLVHSMMAGQSFESLDHQAAANYVKAAKDHVPKTIYLGGLVPPEGTISSHLKSRADVGQILRQSLPTIEFRAGPIIGSGSASFEMLRYLTERLPVMIAPRWIKNEIQPIAVRDVLAYLIAALDFPSSEVIDIGGDTLTFHQMMLTYAEVRGLKRKIFAVRVLAPRLAARWVEFVTPIPNRIAIPLVEGVVAPLVSTSNKARRLFPEIEPITYRRAVELALKKASAGDVETRWSNALGSKTATYEFKDEEGMIREVRRVFTTIPQEAIFKEFISLGGRKGWAFWNWAWRIRGFMDRLIGGPGLRRGRRSPHEALPGEAIDFWRVERVDPPHLLRLRAEMKVPGLAWLQFEAEAQNDNQTSAYIQTAYFAPKGLPGHLYWYLLYPIHRLIFSGMARAIVRSAEENYYRDQASSTRREAV